MGHEIVGAWIGFGLRVSTGVQDCAQQYHAVAHEHALNALWGPAWASGSRDHDMMCLGRCPLPSRLGRRRLIGTLSEHPQ